MERTLVILKPDALQRRLAGRLLQRLEDKGLQVVGLKLIHMSAELAAQQYAEHQGKPFYEPLVRYMTGAPCVVVAVQGVEAVKVVRTLLGATNGRNAAPGTIRGDFGMSAGFNLVHGSDGVERAKVELALFFRPEELHGIPLDLQRWINNDEDLGRRGSESVRN